MKVCACLNEDKVEDCIQIIRSLSREKNILRNIIIEHRLDYLKKNELKKISKLYQFSKQKGIRIIATLRPSKFNGKFIGSDVERFEILKLAILNKCSFIDLDLRNSDRFVKQIKDKIRNTGCKLIISMHDFDKTLNLKELVSVLKKQKEKGADVAKIVCTATKESDNNTMIKLIRKGQDLNIPVVAFCMGDLGKRSRIKCLLNGSPWSYSSIKNATASGQISLFEMLNILEFVKGQKNKNKDKNKIFVIGNPIKHSLSPAMHNKAFEDLGIEDFFDYDKIKIEENNLNFFVDKIRSNEILGANVTIPYKTKVIDLLDDLTKEAKLIGAVNTIFLRNNKLIGHNTDGLGCLNALKEENVEIKNKRILLLGSGGAARAIGLTFGINKVKEIIVLNRTKSSAKKLSDDIESKTKTKSRYSCLDDIKKYLDKIDILVNCTSIGMFGNDDCKTLLKSDDIKKNIIVMDIVYNPIRTKLLNEADKAGCRIIDGVGMLVNQGAISFECWTGIKPSVSVMRKTILKILLKKTDKKEISSEQNFSKENNEKILSKKDNEKVFIKENNEKLLSKKINKLKDRIIATDKSNIALIGFMGTGKTSTGKKLAKILKRDFIETDSLIEKEAKMKISDIFSKYSEKEFRKIEKEIVSKVSDSKNVVISCGGGVILNNKNIENLRKNSFIILLTAKPITILKRVLKTNDRPLLNLDLNKENTNKENANKENANQKNTSQENLNQENTNKEKINKENLNQKNTNKEKLKKIEKILFQREKRYYESADFIFQTDDLTDKQVACKIVEFMKKRFNNF